MFAGRRAKIVSQTDAPLQLIFNRMKWLLPLAFVALVIIRMPSLAQPAGGDQGLYAYAAQEIGRGGLPYRDAWDQKPPAIHYTYALMYGLWEDERVVAAADLAVACLVALILIPLGRRLTGRPGAGEAAAAIFLLFGNPSFTRLSGMWLRSQCETFIALFVTGAVLLVVPRPGRDASPGSISASLPSTAATILAGALAGIAFLYKYNAGIYLLVPASALVVTAWASSARRGAHGASRARLLAGRCAALATGFALPLCLAGVAFVASGAWQDLYQATVAYNLGYSGETYGGFREFAAYQASFPVERSSVDSLWMLGGLGTAVLLVSSWRQPIFVPVPVWVASACLSIAVNSSRGLPQYFVQAGPALALAAGVGGAVLFRLMGRLPRAILLLALAVAVVRVNQFDKLLENTLHDVRFISGRMTEDEYLARFGGQRETDKFAALSVRRLGEYLDGRTAPGDSVLIFGFSAGAYVHAALPSASRFYWSRPVIVEFNKGMEGYGPNGLLADLEESRPKFVVLQQRDWPAERTDSATYFLSTPVLRDWLMERYVPAGETPTYLVWVRRDTAPVEPFIDP